MGAPSASARSTTSRGSIEAQRPGKRKKQACHAFCTHEKLRSPAGGALFLALPLANTNLPQFAIRPPYSVPDFEKFIVQLGLCARFCSIYSGNTDLWSSMRFLGWRDTAVFGIISRILLSSSSRIVDIHWRLFCCDRDIADPYSDEEYF